MKVSISVLLVCYVLTKVVIARPMTCYPKSLGPGMFQNLDDLSIWKAVIECIFCKASPGDRANNLYKFLKN